MKKIKKKIKVRIKEIDTEIIKCHNCGKYFPLKNSIDGGKTCSAICSQQYVNYLNGLD